MKKAACALLSIWLCCRLAQHIHYPQRYNIRVRNKPVNIPRTRIVGGIYPSPYFPGLWRPNDFEILALRAGRKKGRT